MTSQGGSSQCDQLPRWVELVSQRRDEGVLAADVSVTSVGTNNASVGTMTKTWRGRLSPRSAARSATVVLILVEGYPPVEVGPRMDVA